MSNNRGFFGIGIYQPKTTENMGTLWRSAWLYGADFIFTIGYRYKKQPSDTPDTSKHIPLYNYIDYEDFISHLPARSEIVCIELDEKARPLHQAHHPERAIYLLGAEDYGIPKEILIGKQTIQIESLRPQSMNVSVSGTLVMYDRFIKLEAKKQDTM